MVLKNAYSFYQCSLSFFSVCFGAKADVLAILVSMRMHATHPGEPSKINACLRHPNWYYLDWFAAGSFCIYSPRMSNHGLYRATSESSYFKWRWLVYIEFMPHTLSDFDSASYTWVLQGIRRYGIARFPKLQYWHLSWQIRVVNAQWRNITFFLSGLTWSPRSRSTCLSSKDIYGIQGHPEFPNYWRKFLDQR